MKNIAWNSPSKMNLFPLVKARFSGKWFVLCFEVQSEPCRNSTLICSAITIQSLNVPLFWFYSAGGLFMLACRENTNEKKKIPISKSTLSIIKESLQEDCCGNRFCVKEFHSWTFRKKKRSVSFRSFRLIDGTETLKSIKFVYWL